MKRGRIRRPQRRRGCRSGHACVEARLDLLQRLLEVLPEDRVVLAHRQVADVLHLDGLVEFFGLLLAALLGGQFAGRRVGGDRGGIRLGG